MHKYFSGKIVVVTGASAGLGRAIVREFARKGADIGLIARGTEGLLAAEKEVEKYGGRALAITADVSNAPGIEAAAEKIEKELGPIDIWVNNAMVSVFGPFEKIDAADFKRVTEVTYLGQVYGTAAALKRMQPRNKGTILLIGSALAYRGIPLQSAYCGAKHAIHGFFESLRSELIRKNSAVQLGMVQLPAMNTPQFGWVKSYLKHKAKPMGTIYQPEVVAKVVVKIAKNPQRETWAGFSTVKTVLANIVAPQYLDYYFAQKGYEGQQTTQPEDPDRENNLYHPVPGDHGPRGNFQSEVKNFSPQLWAVTHKNTLTAAAIIAGSLAIGIWKAKKLTKRTGHHEK